MDLHKDRTPGATGGRGQEPGKAQDSVDRTFAQSFDLPYLMGFCAGLCLMLLTMWMGGRSC